MNRQGTEITGVSLVAATAIVVGSMVGTGVFTSLGFQVAAIDSGFVILLLWALGGILALCGALCYSELSAALPRSGGEYHLLGQAFHPALGFLAGWVSLTVGFSAPTALAAIAFEHYMLSVFPALPAHGIAPGVIVLATAVYLTRVEIGSTFLATFTYIKLLALLIVSVALMTAFCGESPRFTPASNDLSTLVSAPFAISLVYVMYAYSGWNASTYIVNEIRSPQVNVPRSLIWGTLVVACLYVMVNAGFLISTPTEAYAGRVEVAVIAARFAFGLPGAVMVSLLIGMGLISTVAALTWSGPRVSQMMGQDFPALSVLARTSHTGTPYVAVVVQACIALLMIATSSFEPIMVFMQFVLILSSMLTVSAVVWLRFRRPEMERPFRVPLYPLPPLLFCGVSMLMLVYTAKERAKESLLGFGLVGLGLLVYLACRRASSRPPR